MRLFIAVDLPLLLQAWVAARQSQFQKVWPAAGSALRWTAPGQWHLTLHFIGECPQNRIPDIVSAMQDAARKCNVFRLSLGDPGTFGGPRMGVLWLGVSEGSERLTILTSRLRDALHHRGWSAEKRPFKGHITLARSRTKLSAKRIRELPPELEPCPEAYVDALHLFRSDLSSTGARYTRLHTIPLNSKNQDEATH